MPKQRLFEHGYSLILSEKYRKIRIVSSTALLTVYPTVVYFLTLSVLLSILLPLLYLAYAVLLLASLRVATGGFGKSRFAFPLAIAVSSISSIIDLAVSLLLNRLVAFFAPLLFTSVNMCIAAVMNMHTQGLFRKSFRIALPALSVIPCQIAASTLLAIPLRLFMLADLTALLVSALSVVWTLRLVRKTGTDTMLSLLYAMLESLGSSPTLFELELSKLGQKTYTHIHMFYIRSGQGEEALLLIPYLHFGPLSGMSGSRLLHNLVQRLCERTGASVLYMHGVGSHELDVVSPDSCEEVIRRCEESAVQLRSRNENAGLVIVEGKPVRIDGTYVSVLLVPLPGVDIAIVSRRVNASDDIPCHVYRQVREALADRKIVLVDAQNSFEGESEWTQEEIEELKRLLREAVSRSRDGLFRLRAAWTVREVSLPEVGPLGVHALLLQYVPLTSSSSEKTEVLLVVFDSNNMRRTVRQVLVEKFSLPKRLVEVLTMDDHELVRFVTGRGYRVLGDETSPDEIAEVVSSIVSELEGKLDDVTAFKYQPVTVRVHVLGEEGFNFIKTRLGACIERARQIAALLLALPAVHFLALVLFCLP